VDILTAPVTASGAKNESLRQAGQRGRSQDGEVRFAGPALTHAGAEVLPLGPRLPPFQSLLAPWGDPAGQTAPGRLSPFLLHTYSKGKGEIR
jgi:hypothetical protein